MKKLYAFGIMLLGLIFQNQIQAQDSNACMQDLSIGVNRGIEVWTTLSN